MENNEQILKSKFSKPANKELYETLEGDKVRCFSCGHQCTISPGKSGICKLRFNKDGILYAPYGYVAGLAIDPIEKKPFFHVLPGDTALSFGMLGCNFHCPFCQNWLSSQTLRDPNSLIRFEPISANTILELALQHHSPVIVSTYNEPLITSDWAFEIFSLAKNRGIICGYVSNGHASEKVLQFLRPVTKLFKIDLKTFQQKNYDKLGGKLSTVCHTIEKAVELNYWVEIVTLLVPGFNDSDEELRELTKFIAKINPNIPWHVTGFYPNYKMNDGFPTSAHQLEKAYKIAKDAGLKFVYAGNRPGSVKTMENTYCPHCHELLIERTGFNVWSNKLTDGKCPYCDTQIPGIWSKNTD
ncbi:MAG TPA: AmmeMemoRadiSam system radical SAM enzyme [Candidatus Hydrogenedens sp.]|nr:AmmeMemoRadiSam system radical SAM enzyme [Candidatus Hydrogenedens sp.]